ncbi:MAG: hypothetical protein ACOCPA_00705 [Segatella copri]
MASVDRNMVFPIKNADGSSFNNLVIRKATVDSVVMSLGDKITGDVYYKDNTLQCTMQEYVEYNNVKYTIVNPPTIVREGLVKDNSDLKGMTKYSFEFYHPMYILGNLPFSDVAVSNDENKYLSQNKTFSWIGKPQDYINKINKNLEGTEWIVVKSDRFPKEKDDELSDVLSFDNNTIADALKTGYETWGLPYVVSQINIGEPYYSQGKRFKVEFGLPSNEILVDNEPYIFQFGQGVGLKNNSRTPRNNKIITRIAGYGSENNIPYGYPQIRWYGDQSATETPDGYPIYDGIVGGVVRKLIKHPFTRTHLMPSIYTQTVFNKVSPYLANGSANQDYNPDEEIVDYYDAVYSAQYPYINEINLLAPSYEIHEFADIKPELDSDRQLGIVSAIPLNQDLTPAIQWDDTYDAEKDEYVQSYFKITLPQLSFDIYACASIMEEMQVNMRSGACIGCTFPIQVDWEDYKRNFYDSNGNFLPDGSQRDLTKYPKSNLGQIDIVVQKETQTFGTLMPNIYQQPKANDLFVILGISLPLEYITNAEERLDDVMKSYMLENNVYYYDYPLKFDEHFLSTHTNILSQIRPNSIIRFGFNGYSTPLELFVKQLTVKYGEGVLPQYDITLTDNIEVVLNQIGQVADDVEKLGSLVAILRQTYNRNIWSELDKKLSKVKDDSTPHKLGMGEMQVDGDGAIGNDLSIGGNLSVTGDTELNGDVNIGNSASDEALIKAIAKVFQQIQSHNYSGDSPFDVGWMIKNADANHGNASYMVIDNLFVRMKAIFTELEIRKISYAGGNIVLSHAGSTLVKVVPLTTTMQPTIVNGKLTISGVLARVENNRLILDNGTVSGNGLILDGSQEVLYAYRCYIKKDDGTTATENWWRSDDQSRCQTFNIDETGTYHDVSNSFYWRRVMNVGSEVPIGETTDEVMDYVDLSALDCITGSTVPQAGDVIVQMGNRTDVSRQGFISLEVYGDDAPAFKVYKNVNGYTLNNKMPIIISPYNTSIRARRLSIETDYDVQIVPMERGDWSLIPEHKCYYYDQVQHNGSTWLCIFPEEGSGGVKYTTEEPSLDANWWKVVAQAGKDGSDGKSFNILGSYDTMAELIEAHPTGSVGDAYIVAGDLVVWDDENQQWSNSGRIQGETGNGISGATIHYGTSASNTTVPTNWTANYADLPYTQGEWIWTRVVLSYTDGTSANPYYTQARIGVDGSYKSTAFTRSNKQLSATTPTGGDYSNPLPNQQTVQGEVITWSDGIPAGEAIVWATSRVFTPAGASSGWSTPRQMTDTSSNDVEFSANATKPANPSDNESERDAQGWRDVTRNPSFDFTTAIWRAERTKQNGVWSAWVIEKIKGESITKTGEDVKYALSDSGTVAPQSGWQTTKPTSTDTMRWIWTRTIITWSDTSTTTLYQAERDPNDGIDGMEIVVGTQTIKYAVTDNGSSHPSEDSPLWQDTYTPVQGKWLWSKITTPYIYDGGGSAGTTVSFDVSYIAVDGAKGDKGDKGDTGRGISRVDEYYLAGNSSTTPPTGTWVTNPNNAGWSATNKYLWNYEDVLYTDSTSAPTTKSVVAIWSKDGKGIDSIVNYYKASSNPDEPRPAVDGTEGWTTSIQTISPDAIYLHNYEKITYSDGSTPYRSDSHIIGHWGMDALEASQLVLFPSLVSIPTDTDGVVLEDFRQEIEVSMKTYSDVLALKSVDFTANENVVVEASTLIAMAWSGASVNNGRLVNVEGSVNNGRLTISADDYAVVPTNIVVKATKGTTLTERTVSISATALDEDGNEYNGYNELTVQRQYRAGKPQFPSMVFKRSVTKPATPTGGTYTNPIPEGWEDGIPSGIGIVWASVCTFYGDDTSSGWSEPQAQIDTDNLDLEFSASTTEPSAPTGDVPFADHESEGWYNPTSPNLPEMVIWRAERKVKNGAYDGDWVVTRIYGEKGDTGADAINVALSPFAVLFSQDVSSDDDTAAHAIAQITPETIASQVVVTKGETPITTGVVVSVSSTSHFNTSGVTIEGTTITLDKDGIQVYEKDGRYYPYDNGYVDLNVAYNGKIYPLRLQFYVNLMGKFKTTIEGDVETSIASKTWYEYNPATGEYDKTTTMGEFIRSSSKNTSQLTETDNDTISAMSEVLQKVDNISLTVYENKDGIDLFAHTDDVVVGTSWTTIPTTSNTTNCKTMCVSIPMEIEKKSADSTINFRIYTKNTSGGATIDTIIQSCTFNNGVLTSTGNKSRFDAITSYVRDSKEYVKGVLYFEKTQSSTFKMVDVEARNTGTTVSCTLFTSRKFSVGVSLKDGLIGTGIDIVNGKITNTADQWECQNNSGVKTAWLDDMGNFTVRGVYNNLITVINDSNWDKYIIKIGSGTSSKWYLDVLLCGTFVVIESIPSDVVDEFNASSDGMLHLPYYANDNYFTRGYTRYLDKSTSAPRLMTADELRMLTGRKMVIKWNAITGISNNRSIGYVFRPEVYYGSTTITIDRLNNRLMDLYAGERHCISINPSDTSVNRSPVLYVPRTFFMSFNLVKFHTSQSESNYSWGYIWMADDDSGSASQDDINWT